LGRDGRGGSSNVQVWTSHSVIGGSFRPGGAGGRELIFGYGGRFRVAQRDLPDANADAQERQRRRGH
jgi:hypothetical protein